MPIIKPA